MKKQPVTEGLSTLNAGQLRLAFMFLYALAEHSQEDALRAIQAAKDSWPVMTNGSTDGEP